MRYGIHHDYNRDAERKANGERGDTTLHYTDLKHYIFGVDTARSLSEVSDDGLGPLASESSGQLQVLGLDRDSLSVDRGEVGWRISCDSSSSSPD